MKINCSITSATIYTWQVFNLTDRQKVKLDHVARKIFHDPVLLLPPRSLPYGNYSVMLKVSPVSKLYTVILMVVLEPSH